MVFREGSEAPPLSPILPHLYLGAQSDVTKECLLALGISHVLSVCRSSPPLPFLPECRFHRVAVDDSHCEDMRPWLGGALDFIGLLRSVDPPSPPT
ncbi:dual specificity protein phosphatase 8-like [Acipenser ruthenus]|uniref:dual specificity protein phosphatase 8-like n=1 Tax=Acipenser ruthenus TaxID=7906 RepID=UPI002741A773|nr:dual specificity protein phosphatase 8-like [Acipenser ruthenus]